MRGMLGGVALLTLAVGTRDLCAQILIPPPGPRGDCTVRIGIGGRGPGVYVHVFGRPPVMPPHPWVLVGPPTFCPEPEVVVGVDRGGNRERREPPPPEPNPPPAPVRRQPPPPEPPREPAKPRVVDADRPPRKREPDADQAYTYTLALGKTAFAAQEYGRAAERFRRAIGLRPNDGAAYFLLAQVLFVLGKFDQAVGFVGDGLKRRPDWPAARFRPRELHGANDADHQEALRRLAEAVARRPDDGELLFLYAYQLWFDGRQDEAARLFERAAPRLTDRTAAQKFLQARPAAGPVL